MTSHQQLQTLNLNQSDIGSFNHTSSSKKMDFSSLPRKFIIFYTFPNLSIKISNFLSLNILLFLLTNTITITATKPSSIYDYLRHHGLPVGLFPKGITEFSHDPSTGRFEVFLKQPCNAKFENQFHYDFNVSGTLSFGRIGKLSGVSAQELFLWFDVKDIRVDVPSSGLIYFDVGVVDKQFSLSLFESSPDCTAVYPSDPSFNGGGHSNDPGDEPQSGSQNSAEKIEYEFRPRNILRAVS